MERIESEFIDEYKKSKRFEDVLSLMNESLYSTHDELLQNNIDNQPIIHVIGVPRSGTTLLTQYLASSLDIGYINNLIAAFWKAPIYGIQLSKQLLGNKFSSKFTSEYGRTENLAEPHEFGYFWNTLLNYDNLMERSNDHEQLVNWSYLNKLVNNMASTFDKPLLFKSFLLGFHALKQYKENNKTLFIYVSRDKMDNAHSIYKLREKVLGNVNKWGSIKPLIYPELKKMDVFHQIAGQIYYLDKKYREELTQIPPSNTLYIKYDEFCEKPSRFAKIVSDKINDISGADIQQNINEKDFFDIRVSENEFVEKFEKSFLYFEKK